MQTFNFYNQQVNYNHNTKTLFFKLGELFYSAGHQLKWMNHKPQGIGINIKIYDFICSVDGYFTVKIGDSEKTLWADVNRLKFFARNNSCDWIEKGVHLKVFPKDIFSEIQKHIEI